MVIFRTELRKETQGQEYEETGRRMYEVVSGRPGFISFKGYVGEDGELPLHGLVVAERGQVPDFRPADGDDPLLPAAVGQFPSLPQPNHPAPQQTPTGALDVEGLYPCGLLRA